MLAANEEVPFPLLVHGIHHDLSPSDIQEILSALEHNDLASPSFGLEGPTRSVYSVDERRKRRMISNRESARRSRWRKKQHLEDLMNQANRLNLENQELENQLASIVNQFHVLMRENECLRSEYEALWVKLSDLYQVLAAMQM